MRSLSLIPFKFIKGIFRLNTKFCTFWRHYKLHNVEVGDSCLVIHYYFRWQVQLMARRETYQYSKKVVDETFNREIILGIWVNNEPVSQCWFYCGLDIIDSWCKLCTEPVYRTCVQNLCHNHVEQCDHSLFNLKKERFISIFF